MDSFTFSLMKLAAATGPRKILVMGVSGSGKTTVGRLLADRIGAVFVEADELHPPENVAKMKSGVPLDDADRWPWLDRFSREMAAIPGTAVGACSALKRSYRDRIRDSLGAEMMVVFLHGEHELLEQRMAGRRGHFMPASLLESQLATLEPPAPEERALTLDVTLTPDQLVDAIVAELRDRQAVPFGGRPGQP